MIVRTETWQIPSSTVRYGPRRPLLDVVAEVLVANPGASLAAVAAAAGIGRTTLHKHYATRDDLVTAVAHRAIDTCEQAVASAQEHADGDGGLRRLVDALIPVGPQLSFLFRQPSLDDVAAIGERMERFHRRVAGVVHAAQDAGVLDATRPRPDWWHVEALHALVYVAWESIRDGRLARLDATDLVLNTLLRGLGAHDQRGVQR